MEIKTLIPAHPGFHNPVRQTIFFHNHLKAGPFSPRNYTTVSHVSGKVQLVEYDSHKEYRKHRSEIFKAVERYHKTQPISGCACKSCK